MSPQEASGKKEKARQIEELLKCQGFELVLKEIEEERARAQKLANDRKQSHADRDAGTGKVELCEYLLSFAQNLAKGINLDLERLRKEAKARS